MKRRIYFSKMKMSTCLLLLSAGLISATSVFAQDVTTGLKLRYTFDAVSGTTVTDDAGNGNTATMVGAPIVVTGNDGSAVNLPLKTDYLQLPNDITTSLGDFTIASWVKLDALNSQGRIFDFGTSVTSGNPQKYMILSGNGTGGKLRFAITTGSYTVEQGINGTSALPTGKWVHVAVSLSGTTATLYVNGAVVGTNTNMTLTPASLGSTDHNYIGKSQWSGDGALAGSIDDFRMYDRALTSTDILYLTGLAELNKQTSLLKANTITTQDSAAITSNITLPAILGTQGVTVKWTSSNNAAIDTFGVVNRLENYNAPVKLTATLSQNVNGKTYSTTKDFIFIVAPINEEPAYLATWDFEGSRINIQNGVTTVTDANSGFVGTCKSGARIRTIGESESGQYKVLDLGANNGYFDMGSEIGKALYSLTDYTIAGYFRLPAGYSFSGGGHFLCNFSNRDSSLTNYTGNMMIRLNAQRFAITPQSYQMEQGVQTGTTAAVDGWHHIAYTQTGTTGALFIDGVLAAQNTAIANVPGIALHQNGMTGTRCNWLGRSSYIADVYLKNALIYKFQMLSYAVSPDDFIKDRDFDVPATIAQLNAAFTANQDYVSAGLAAEMNNLSIGDTTVALTSNLTLPSKGTLDPTINIAWSSNHNDIITDAGVVNQPNYHPYKVKLTATLSQNGNNLTKSFTFIVPEKSGTAFNNDLLVKYDFASVTNDTIVTDAAEKHFTGILKNKAKVHTIGDVTTGMFNVLALGDSIGYFDMGTEMGKQVYGLGDYTIGAFFRIDAAYPSTELAKNGNFLWSLSNASNIFNSASGYMIGSLKTMGATISASNWSSEQTVAMKSVAPADGWHHIAYTQSGTVGQLYVDGNLLLPGTVNQLPSTSLVRDQQLGTLYNWLGRSCYATDAYLRKTLVTDFRLYKRALTDDEIMTSVLGIDTKLPALEAAYAANTGTAVNTVKTSKYVVTATEGQINIHGLTGGEKVSVFDITGREFKVTTPSATIIKPGIYIVKVNDTVTKVIVK